MKHLVKKMTLLTLLVHGFSPSFSSEEPKKSPDTSKADVSKEEKTKENPAPASPQKGWFIGLRAAYVPSAVGEIGYQFNQTFKVRLFGLTGRYSRTLSLDGQQYNGIRFKPQKIGLMMDWHLWKNGFRLTAGLAYNRDRINLSHVVTGTLLGQPATAYGTITANYKFRDVAPYFGLGYDTGSLGDCGISLSAEGGFWFQGKAHTTSSFTGTGQNNPAIVYNVQDQTSRLLNKHKLNQTTPMVSLGIRYMF